MLKDSLRNGLPDLFSGTAMSMSLPKLRESNISVIRGDALPTAFGRFGQYGLPLSVLCNA